MHGAVVCVLVFRFFFSLTSFLSSSHLFQTHPSNSETCLKVHVTGEVLPLWSWKKTFLFAFNGSLNSDKKINQGQSRLKGVGFCPSLALLVLFCNNFQSRGEGVLCPAISPASPASYSMAINRFFQAETITAVMLLLFTILETPLSPLAHLYFHFYYWSAPLLLGNTWNLHLAGCWSAEAWEKTCGESLDRIIFQFAFSASVVVSQGRSFSAISAQHLMLFYIFLFHKFML